MNGQSFHLWKVGDQREQFLTDKLIIGLKTKSETSKNFNQIVYH